MTELNEWSDGADSGISAEAAMKAAITGEAPTEKDLDTPESLRARLEELYASFEADHSQEMTYDSSASLWAAIVLKAYDETPALVEMPIEDEYVKVTDDDGLFVGFEKDERGEYLYTARGIAYFIKRLYTEDDWQIKKVYHSLSGFQFGWGVNAARFAVGSPPQQNPALMVIHRQSGGK